MTTDLQDELLTQVDKENIVVGPIPRGVAHASKDVYYRTIYVLVKNEQNEILLQKRSATKDLYPNCWDLSVGGHVVYGDSYEETALRELREELGITANLKDTVKKGEVLVSLPNSNEYFYVYEYQLKASDEIQLASAEIAETKWLGIEKIKKSIEDKSLLWYPRPIQVIKSLY